MAACPPEGMTMPNLFAPLWSLRQAHAASFADASTAGGDDDLALGFESANPALQFESWEPAPAVPGAALPGH